MNDLFENLSDPIRVARQAIRRIVLVGGVMTGVVLVWALWPATGGAWSNPTVAEPSMQEQSASTATTDVHAYKVAIWTPPPAPPVEPPKPQQIALKFQLIGIHRETTGQAEILRATLYDPATDRIHIVADGDKLGSFTITSVTAKGVDISDGTTVRTLALDAGGKSR